MSDEEKVLSDLKDIVEYFMRLYREEEDHHIYDQHYDRMVVVSNACNLIEELLKAQEPRVLTLEEVKTIGTQNYNQIRDENTRFIWSEEEYALKIAKPTYYDFGLEDSEEEPIYLYYIGTDFFNHFDQNTYGKTWRCWSAKPTDEQREAVPWQE